MKKNKPDWNKLFTTDRKDPLTEEELSAYVADLFESKKPVRKIIALSGCINLGWVEIGGEKWESCHDPKCPGCSFRDKILHETLLEESKKFTSIKEDNEEDKQKTKP